MTKHPLRCAAFLATSALSAAVAAVQTKRCIHLAAWDHTERGSFDYVHCTRCDKVKILVRDTKDFVVWSTRWYDLRGDAEQEIRWWLDGPESVGLISR